MQQTISTLTYNSDPTDPLNPDPPTAVVAADFDGNGFVDIAFTEPGHNSIGVLSGNGNGTFAARVDYPAGESPTAPLTGNLNGGTTSLGLDRLDLVAVDPTQDPVSVLLGQKYTSTTTLNPNVSTITWGGSVSVTPVVNPGYASQQMPLTGSYQLVVDGLDPMASPNRWGHFWADRATGGPAHVGGNLPRGRRLPVEHNQHDYLLTVVPAELTVTADNKSRAYGVADRASRTASPGLSTATYTSSPWCRTRTPR